MAEFFQDGPQLENEFEKDFLLQAFLKARFSPEQYQSIQKDLMQFGAQATSTLLELAAQAEKEQPELVAFDPWGRRQDLIKVSEAWKELHAVSAREGLVALGFERKFGGLSRLYQFSKLYLFHSSSAFYSCPLAMADGAARVLELTIPKVSDQKSKKLFEEAFKHLTARTPEEFWTSGQWMTEKTGGSDVSRTSTVARKFEDHYKLSGVKWFSSATTSEMALGLARIEGAPEGSKGLSLFYIPMRKPDGSLNGIEILRLKDKLGTKALATAELKLEGTQAWRVSAEGEGVKAVSTMLNITRLYNAISSVSQMRRILALSISYSKKRRAFGATLDQQPLHAQTISEQLSKWAQASVLTWHLTHLLGREEVGQNTPEETMVLRLFTPVAKLWTAKLCVQVTSEGVESFGGAGYIEDTGLPVLLRNAQVFPIWEGTTNVLSLDVLRVLERSPEALSVFAKEVRRITDTSKNCSPEVRATIGVRLEQLQKWSATLLTQRNEVQQRYARHFAFYLGELYSQALLVELGEASDFKQIKNLVSLIPNQKFEILPSFENSQATEWMFE